MFIRSRISFVFSPTVRSDQRIHCAFWNLNRHAIQCHGATVTLRQGMVWLAAANLSVFQDEVEMFQVEECA